MKRTLTLTIALLAIGGLSLLTLAPAQPAVAQESAPQGGGDELAGDAPVASVPVGQGGGEEEDANAGPADVAIAVPPPEDQGEPEEGGIEAPILDAASSRLSAQILLKDGGGVPLVGPVDLEFRIWNASVAGAVVEGPILMPGVPLTNGVADVQVPVTPSSFDGSGRWLGVRVVPDPELAPRIPLTSVAYAIRVDRVTSEELDDFITLGGVGNGFGALQTRTSTGDLKNYLYGASWGELNQYDSDGTETVSLDANSNTGGSLRLDDTDGSLRALLSTDTTTGTLGLYDSGDVESVQLSGSGHSVRTFGSDGLERTKMYSFTWGQVILRVKLYFTHTVFLHANNNTGGSLQLDERDGATRVKLNAEDDNANQGGQIQLRDASSTITVDIQATELGTDGSSMFMYNAAGNNTIELEGEFAGSGEGFLAVKDGSGVTQIILDGDSGGCGKITTDILTVNGCDLAERFDVNTDEAEVKPGMVVSIDPTKPGNLRVSGKAYDRTVAGIVSGAGDIKVGMMLGEGVHEKAGDHPVALTGRVYCQVDASNGAIEPGDLLTTSDVPGHAMKVTDYTRAQGAILGKAMSSLKEGKGLVLVLVTLQ